MATGERDEASVHNRHDHEGPFDILRAATASTRLLIGAAVMAAALLLLLVVAGTAAGVLVHLFLRHHRGDGGEKPGPPAGLSREELRRLPSAREAAALRWSECVVCLDDLREGERFRELPECRHAFHKACVDKWLLRSPVCPVCRAVIVPAAPRKPC